MANLRRILMIVRSHNICYITHVTVTGYKLQFKTRIYINSKKTKF